MMHWSRKALKAQIPQGEIFQEDEPYVALWVATDMDLCVFSPACYTKNGFEVYI